MNSAASNLEFIDTYHKRAKEFCEVMKKDFITVNFKPFTSVTSRLKLVQFKDLDNWDPFGDSKNLLSLADKITNMIQMGRADSVKRMLVKISSGRVKKLYHIQSKHNIGTYPNNPKKVSLGVGSFRWNYGAIILTPKEVKFVKEYFEL